MTFAAFWWVNPVQVKTYLSTLGTGGDVWDDDYTTVQCWVEEGTKLVLNSEGEEVVSTTDVHGPLDQAALFAPGSLVLTPGQTDPARVLSLDRFDSGSLGLGVDHFVAHLN